MVALFKYIFSICCLSYIFFVPLYFGGGLKTEFHQIEERRTMKYVTSCERDAPEEGVVRGKELGVVRAQ
jgi:hypothetical protein